MTKEELFALIDAEQQGNLHILIDPKKKDSFAQSRINVWKQTIKDRIYYYFIEHANNTK